ncbi:MAG TPA: SOS response-associated peptidase [Dermatophilaceae bacterium]|nr:SOS response-associated peptidase [Dermatophilaceae bacterium]
MTKHAAPLDDMLSANALVAGRPGPRGMSMRRHTPCSSRWEADRMCGRYAVSKTTDELVEEFEVVADLTGEPTRSLLKSPQQPPAGQPDYNVAPTKAARVVLSRQLRVGAHRSRSPKQPDPQPRADPALVRQLRLLTWGLVPSWASSPAVGARMINARAEEAMTTRAFAAAVRSRRCLVPATGWYEWHPIETPTSIDALIGTNALNRTGAMTDAAQRPRALVKGRRQPFFVSRLDGASAALAGLYEFWRDPTQPEDDPAWLTSFAIVTTQADPELTGLHERQPLVLERSDWADWLDADSSAAQVEAMLRFRRPGRFAPRPVGLAVGNSRASGPELIAPVSLPVPTGQAGPTGPAAPIDDAAASAGSLGQEFPW